MKGIDVRWVENSKTKNTSLKTVAREKFNDYPEGTATVQLENIKSKNPDARVWFIFKGKNDTVAEWDYQKQVALPRSIVWRTTVQVDLIYKENIDDYYMYINFPNGKYNAPLLDSTEFDLLHDTVKKIRHDLNNTLTVNNFRAIATTDQDDNENL